MTEAAPPIIAALPEDASTEPPFLRLHPLSIVLKSLAIISQNLIALGVLHFSLFDGNGRYTALAAAVLLTATIGISALIWSRFSYQVGAREIRIKSGLLSRNNRSIPLDRIQDVSLEQKLISRILGLAMVRLETGASAGEDDKLNALSLAKAKALRDRIRDYKSQADDSETADPVMATETEDQPPLFAMDNRRLLIAGLFNFSFILFAIIGAIAQNLDFLVPREYFNPWYWAEQFGQPEVINGLSLSTRIVGVVSALLALIGIGVTSGIIRTVVREYGFRLDLVNRGQPGFRRRRGLFTLTDTVMPLHRVQAAILQTGPIRERFGWYHLKFQSLASDGSGESDHSVAPCASQEEMAPILAETEIRNSIDAGAFHGVNPAMWWRDALILLVVLGALAIGLGLFLHPGFFALILLGLPLSVIQFLNWRRHRYALDGDQLFVTSGWWRRKLTILPIRKIQTVDISQAPLDHPLDLATITVGIAGGSSIAPLKINHLDAPAAVRLRERLLPQP